MEWGSVKWVAFGDSLTDPTIPSPWSDGNPKYHTIIATRLLGDSAVNLESYEPNQLNHLAVAGVGGTGYWATNASGTCFYQRMRQLSPDPDVDIVTIFGSVNDHPIYIGGLGDYAISAGKRVGGGENVGFGELGDSSSPSDSAIAAGVAMLTLDDTISAGDNTFVAYVNECINLAHEKFQNAKIVLVHEIAFYNTKAGQLRKERAIKEAIVQKRRAGGDEWLGLYKLNESRFEGLDRPERLYVNTVGSAGLSFDFGQIQDPTFRVYYTYERNGNQLQASGHPNALYSVLWLAPMFAQILKGCFPDTQALPNDLSVGSYDASALWLAVPEGGGGTDPGEPDNPDPPLPPVTGDGVLYLIGGAELRLTEVFGVAGGAYRSVWRIGGTEEIRLWTEPVEPDVDDTAVLGVAVLGTMILGKAS